MKKVLTVLVVALLAMGLTACGPKKDPEATIKVALLIPFRGDQSYFDVVANGMKLVSEQIEGSETTIIEMGTDQSKWENFYLDACEGDYDVIIGGNWEATPTFEKVIAQFPDKKFINFDNSAAPTNPNTYVMFYKANELGYLTGLVAGLVTKTNLEFSTDAENIIGAIGGMEFSGINDFLYGYIQGAQAVNPDVKIIIGYAGSFSDAAKGKEIALNMYAAGADIIFHAAGGTGNGLFDAAVEAQHYALGVDADQALLFASDPAKQKLILTSGTKNVDLAILQAVERFMDGTLPYNTIEVLGIKENGVSLAENDIYNALPASIRDVVAAYKAKVVSGEIVVKNALTLTADEWNAIKASVAPVQ
jgi:basic membrane protein A